ncbi:MAG: outer membrane lipoprotein carrier protein LolA [Nitrosomonadales bacterium]|nr:outer membrane lipoprotein carrier protein LolA [Nitrosomonadales bacterium]
MRRLTSCWLFSLMLGIASMPALADEVEQAASAWTVTELMQGLAQVKKSSATFIELKHLSMLKEPLAFSGTLEYTAPGRLEKRTLLPKPESMVLDRDRLEVQSGGAGKKRVLSLQAYPAIWAFVESIRSTLAGDLDTLNRFYRVSLEGQRGKWQLTLLPLDSKMKDMVSEIRIGGSGEQVNTIEIREAGGDYSVMSISKGGS